MNPFKFIRFTYDKHIFKIIFEIPAAQVLLQVAHNTYISGPFYEKANLPPNLHYFWYTYAIVQGALITFFYFIKGFVLISKFRFI